MNIFTWHDTLKEEVSEGRSSFAGCSSFPVESALIMMKFTRPMLVQIMDYEISAQQVFIA